MLANIVWRPKLANIHTFLCVSIQVIDGNCIFDHSLAKLANIPQDKKVGKHTPLNDGGLA